MGKESGNVSPCGLSRDLPTCYPAKRAGNGSTVFLPWKLSDTPLLSEAYERMLPSRLIPSDCLRRFIFSQPDKS